MQNFIKFQDRDFEAFVTKEFGKQSKEIFSVEYEGKKYWVKKGRKTSSNIFHKIFYKILPFEALIPVENKSAVEAILFETNKLIEFKKLGINVPDVIGSNEKFFVMTDCGESLYNYLKYFSKTQEEFNNYLELYIKQLSQIHSSNNYHGGAQSRNFTFYKNNIYAIDLEDSFHKNVDIITLQFRDLLLMLLSMSKIKKFQFSYKEIVLKYIELTGNEGFKKKLKLLSGKFKFLLYFYNKNFLKKRMSRDVVNFLRLVDELEKV